ncbi:MAG: alpha-L-fucosidase [Cytophagales bacterium]|jgi:alpha-L-fucosidase|nr:alpha-L-fucosidase [Cytophagales bacterium]
MKKSIRTLFFLFFTVICSAQTDEHIQTEWKQKHTSKAAALEEFNDLKFGMFIHWGLYSIPAGEWKGQKIPGLAEWIMYHAFIPKSEYGALAAQFNPVQFNAEQWAVFAKNAGMKYLVITAKHHDGFAMYDSQVSGFNVVKATPFKRDPIDELYQACKKHGIRFGVYYSHIIDWWDGWDGGMLAADRKMTDMDKKNPMNTWDANKTTRETYINNKAKLQVAELLRKYPDMVQVWFDYWYEGKSDLYTNRQISYDFYSSVYNLQPKCLVSSRIGGGLGDYAAAGDNEIPTEGRMTYWETPGTLNNTWGYNKFDKDWKATEELLFWIAEIASKGGNYLLNVGPKADGSFPAESVRQLESVGKWMKTNGEAIYGTKKWALRREGSEAKKMKGTEEREREGFRADFKPEDFWFTAKGKTVYAIALKPAPNRLSRIRTFGQSNATGKSVKIQKVSVLGTTSPVKWKQTAEALEVQIPASLNTPNGYTVKIEFD